MRKWLWGALGLCVLNPAQGAQPGDAERGKTLYESRCNACHSLEANRVGPLHRGVFGRRSGSVQDYDYSPALKKSKIDWNEKTLDVWLRDPEKAVPGQKMGFQVPEAADRADLIAYLRRESGK
jgi:cytochrome c